MGRASTTPPRRDLIEVPDAVAARLFARYWDLLVRFGDGAVVPVVKWKHYFKARFRTGWKEGQ